MDERAKPLDERDLAADPLRQFEAWFAEAAGVVRAPEAMVVATTTPGCLPSARMVLLKAVDERGFVFYTHYDSRKGRELSENPRAALLFYWDPLGRQVRVEGRASPVEHAESEAYFATRPRGAQLGAHASRQSEVLARREQLEERVAELDRRYEGREVPLPDGWGGIRVAPETYEFWQHREDRLHDRFRYRRPRGGGWTIERLYP